MTAEPVRRGAPLDLRLAPTGIAVWGATAWAVVTPARTGYIAAGVAAALCLGLLIAARLRRVSPQPVAAGAPQRGSAVRAALTLPTLAIAVGVAASALMVAATQQAAWERSELRRLTAAEATVTVSGVVGLDPAPLENDPQRPWLDNRWRVTLHLDTVTHRGHAYPAADEIVIIGGAAWQHAQAGAAVTATGRLLATAPGDGARALFFPITEPSQLAPRGGVLGWGATVREALRRAAEPLPTDPGALIPSMTVGDVSKLDPQLKQAMRTTGLTHLTAVSGTNCTMVVGTAMLLAKAPRTWSRRRRAAMRAAVGLAALAGFVAVTGPEASVFRAAVMGCVALIAVVAGRRSAAAPALACAIVVLLLFDPLLARSAGFALSVLATAGIITIARPLAEKLQTWRVPRALALAIAVTSAAQLACTPVLLALDPHLTVYALPANLLAGSLVAPITVLGITAAALAPLWQMGATALLYLAALPAAAVAQIARVGAQLPVATIAWPPSGNAAASWMVIAAVVVAGLAAGAVILARRGKIRRGRPLWAAAIAVALLLSAIGCGGATGWLPGRAGHLPANWRVVMCDVAQGDAMLIRTGDQSAIMIDVGPPGDQAAACLRNARIDVLDLLVITHWHADHYGGLDNVLAQVAVRQALLPAWPHPRTGADRAVGQLAAAKVPTQAGVVDHLGVGTFGQAGSVAWQVLWPTIRAIETTAPGASDGTTINDLSVVLALRQRDPSGGQGEDLTIVALGDLETAGQAGLLRELRRSGHGGVDVIKLAHHGSARQSEQLAEILAPRLALVGVGADNDHGHPTNRALDLYQARGALIGRTDTDGYLAVHDGPHGLQLTPQRVGRYEGGTS